jgi:hypothetical protein
MRRRRQAYNSIMNVEVWQYANLMLGGDIFLRNASWLSVEYMAIFPTWWNCSRLFSFSLKSDIVQQNRIICLHVDSVTYCTWKLRLSHQILMSTDTVLEPLVTYSQSTRSIRRENFIKFSLRKNLKCINVNITHYVHAGVDNFSDHS